MDTANVSKTAAGPSPPLKKSPHESGAHVIDARMVHLVMADPCLLWSEAAAILGIEAADIEQENDS